MTTDLPMPEAQVAVVIIAFGKEILLPFNPKWGAFSLPMTKRRKWFDPNFGGQERLEEWRAAAVRASAEVLGRTFDQNELPVPLADLKDLQQMEPDSGLVGYLKDLIIVDFKPSVREQGLWKRYELHIFALALGQKETPATGMAAEWLAPPDYKKRHPISPTATRILDHLAHKGLLPPWQNG